jgi:DUF4097 and DUF4098 domain-containing protein YvlB
MKVIAMITLAGVVGLSADASLAAALDERIDAAGADVVEIVNRSGSVSVMGGSDDVVVVSGSLGSNTLGLDLDRDGDRIVVAVRYPKGDSGRHMESTLNISMPAAVDLVVRSISADVEVGGIDGEQRLNTISGDIATAVRSADVELRTVSGDMAITGRNEAAVLKAASVSGDFGADGLAGQVDAATTSGDLQVVAGMLERARLASVSGDIEVRATVASKGSLVMESTSGDVVVVLEDAADISVEAETFSGSIDNCFNAETDSGFGAGESLRFSMGEGDRSVRAMSFSGNLDVCDS